FFSSRRRHSRFSRDWSSDVCSSDLTFERLERDVAPEIRRYYQTRDPLTGELIQVLYYFWVKTVTTPEGEVIPLLSRYVFSQDARSEERRVGTECRESGSRVRVHGVI